MTDSIFKEIAKFDQALTCIQKVTQADKAQMKIYCDYAMQRASESTRDAESSCLYWLNSIYDNLHFGRAWNEFEA